MIFSFNLLNWHSGLLHDLEDAASNLMILFFVGAGLPNTIKHMFPILEADLL